MNLATKPLGAPIEGEDRGATVTCSACGKSYGLYGHGVRVDFHLRCERRKGEAGDRAAMKRYWRLDKMYQDGKKAAQRAAADALRRAGWASPR